MAFEPRDIGWVFYRPSCGCVAHLAYIYAEPHVSLRAPLPEFEIDCVNSFGVKVVYGGS